MMSPFSTHHDGGGPIHLHSPSSIHRDTASALRQLRRSLSRSPSKSSDHRHLSSRSHSPAKSSAPFSPSPLSPSRVFTEKGLVHSVSSPSPLASPHLPGHKAIRPPMRRVAASQPIPDTRTPPKSPSRRILVENTNQTCATQHLASSQQFDQPLPGFALFREEDKENEGNEGHSSSPRIFQSKSEKRRSLNFSSLMSASSPLKRSDGIMNLDQISRGSPSAKRRSLHGPSFSPADFNAFETNSKAEQPRRRSEEGEVFAIPSASSSATHVSGIPKRSSSLRKSTLQQRQHERPGQASSKSRQRMSLDSIVPANQRETSLSQQVPLSTTSMQTMRTQNNSHYSYVPHPLHQSMTQSSSNSSLADDSPTHEPSRRTERPKSMLDFSKSLPIGASRPLPDASFTTDTGRSGTQGSFATPQNYKLAKPDPIAFRSEGLVSKMAQDPDRRYGRHKANMPDTPCKPHTTVFSLGNGAPQGTSNASKFNRHSFGSPWTPFNFEDKPKKIALPSARRSHIFDSPSNRHSPEQSTSFTSIEGDNVLQGCSPTSRFNSQSTDSELPNTPTKFATHPNIQRSSTKLFDFHLQDLKSDDPRDAQNLPPKPDLTQNQSSFSGQLPDSHDEDSDSVMEDSPSSNFLPNSSLHAATAPASSARTQLPKSFKSPTPLSRKDTCTTPFAVTPAAIRTNAHSLSPASPLQDKFDRNPPQTPRESLLPPDPSGLSISGNNDKGYFNNASSSASVLPATPTARDYSFGDERVGLALVPGNAPDVDSSLMERFERAEAVGNGEFSIVYKVTQPPEVSAGHTLFSVTPGQSPPQSCLSEKVWAVKKSKKPYAGPVDRRHKLNEVEILKDINQSDHIIHLVDSWEDRNYLYIQTEFCEEGTLQGFLEKQGSKGRLDDFRIWKIMLELTQGLKHIHDSNIIHLDMKPANILITFEGVLKIADFGMATRWPSESHFEREGDREYLAPEVMRGKLDKSADIFALGLIMLETAGNVYLPENGDSWQKLRNGDMSDVPSLTWSSDNSTICRDEFGDPLPEGSREALEECSERFVPMGRCVPGLPPLPSNHAETRQVSRSGELINPPEFMVNAQDDEALDKIVRWMIDPVPEFRPVAHQIIETAGVQFAENRRRAGATIFEGKWGPADDVLLEDAEMMDV